jgi:hypothetical protein
MIYEDKELAQLRDNIIEYWIATEEELQLITNINWYNIDTLNDVLYARTWYHDREQYSESE